MKTMWYGTKPIKMDSPTEDVTFLRTIPEAPRFVLTDFRNRI